MAVKSVISIDIDDSDFQRFAAIFRKYSEELKTQPHAWHDVAAASATAAAAAAEMGANVGAGAYALHKANTEAGDTSAHARRTAGFWSSIAQSAGKFTGRVIEATRSLLRWGELTGLISGILGAGGLFGIDRLAMSAATQRQRAFQLGATPGEVAGANIELARFTDPQAFMSSVNEGMHFITSEAHRAMMQLGVHPEDRTDAASTAFDTILALKGKLDQLELGPMFGNQVDTLKYTSLMPFEDLKKLRETPRAEVETQVARGREDQARFQYTPDQARIWQELETTFDRVSKALKHDLTVRLTELAPALEHMSNSFLHVADVILNNPHMEKWINEVAGAMDRFAKYLTEDNVGKDIDYLMGKLDDVFGGIGRVVKEIPEIVDAFSDAVKAIKNFFADPLGTIKEGGVNGPFENPLNDPGSDEFNKKRDMEHHPDRYDDQGNLKEKRSSLFDDLFNNSRSLELNKKLHPERFDEQGNPKDRPAEAKEPWDETGWRQWMPWNWHMVSATPPPTPEQKTRFDDLEGSHNLPAGTLNAVMQAESRGDPTATSSAGAKGQFQFMDATAQTYGVQNPRDFTQASGGAARYLHSLLQEFGGDLAKAAAGYNWGEQNVEKDIAVYHEKWREHLPTETQRYVAQVTSGQQTNPQPKFVPPAATRSPVVVKLYPEPGANPYISTSQLAY